MHMEIGSNNFILKNYKRRAKAIGKTFWAVMCHSEEIERIKVLL